MPVFTRILDFKRTVLARLRDKRRHPRHRVGVAFPLKASLSLVGSSNPGADRNAMRDRGVNWSGVLGDVSSNGLSILLSPAATTGRGESTLLRLTVESHVIEIPCTVAHFRVYNSHAHCGVQLEFADFKAQKAYLQLVEAVKLGASFGPPKAGRTQNGLATRSWRSVNQALLTEWRAVDGRALDHFELILGEHTVSGRKSRPGLEIHSRRSKAKAVPPGVDAEVRQLFRWVVGNLPKQVPADLRELMARAGGTASAPSGPAAWEAPAPAPRPFAPTVITTPPGLWQPPKVGVEADSVA